MEEVSEILDKTYWDFEQSHLQSHLDNKVDSKIYRKILSFQIDLLEKHNGRKLLLFIPDNFELDKSEKFFTNHIYLPKMIQKGLKCVAVVGPMNNVFKEILIENLKDSLEEDILESAFFQDEEKARKWLNNQ